MFILTCLQAKEPQKKNVLIAKCRDIYSYTARGTQYYLHILQWPCHDRN